MTDFKDCANCGRTTPSDEIITDRESNLTCMVCYELITASANTINEFTLSGKRTFTWTSEFGFRSGSKSVYQIPAISGYTHDNTPMTHPDYIILFRDAVVKFNDPESAKLVKFVRGLTTGVIVPPFTLYLSMIQLGELSMKIDVVVNRRDVDRFRTWTSQLALN